MKQILVAVDGSEGADRAARFAAQPASQSGAQLELSHVYDAPIPTYLGLQAVSAQEVKERCASLGEGSLDAAGRAVDGLAQSTHHLSVGHPAEERANRTDDRANRVEELGAGVIATGSRALRGVSGAFADSVGRRLLTLARRPVSAAP